MSFDLSIIQTSARFALLVAPLLIVLATAPVAAESLIFDLGDSGQTDGAVTWVYGATGLGVWGVPVAAGADCDGDQFEDYAIAFFQTSPLGRSRAGEIDLVFGNGTIGEELDTATTQARILRIVGAATLETAGNEIWFDDVTGDEIGDVLICRQNFSLDGRIGAGALTILTGGRGLRTLAETRQILDLATTTTVTRRLDIVGPGQYDRFGIWMRTGDVTGDGIADLVVGADQIDAPGEANRGAVYVIRGGPHLANPGMIDLAGFGATALAGHIAMIHPPAGSEKFHLGATCQIADLDRNGRGEVLMAAALNRAGAGFRPLGAPADEYQASGGSPQGTLYIAWDDNFSTSTWPAGFEFTIPAGGGSFTIIDGGADNKEFGEELIGGLDYDQSGWPELYVGDLSGDGSPQGDRRNSGISYVFYDAVTLRGLTFDLDDPPEGIRFTTILGPNPGAISGDTTIHGDLDGDGVADLVFGSPHANPAGRDEAGTIHVFYGQPGGWPELIDTSPENFLTLEGFRWVEIRGAQGDGPDRGDVICYSAAPGDVDGDGRTDIIANEMTGNGVAPGATDVGNLIIISGAALLPPRSAVRYWFHDSVNR